jgi:hypothetical protein
MTHSERFDLDFPDDYPVAALQSIHAHVSDGTPTPTETTEWKEWASALNGLMYRFLAFSRHHEKVSASLTDSPSPPQPERYRQEKWLFAFFFEGLSSLECLCYGLYFIGVMAEPTQFDVNEDRRNITIGHVANAYATAFPAEALSQRLASVAKSGDLAEWRDVRNFLSHRGAPGRTFYEGGPQSGQVDWNLPLTQVNVSVILEPADLQRRRGWLADAVTEISEAAEAFVQTHVS